MPTMKKSIRFTTLTLLITTALTGCSKVLSTKQLSEQVKIALDEDTRAWLGTERVLTLKSQLTLLKESDSSYAGTYSARNINHHTRKTIDKRKLNVTVIYNGNENGVFAYEYETPLRSGSNHTEKIRKEMGR